MSAAAFAKGLLDLEGQLTPILVFSFLSVQFWMDITILEYLAHNVISLKVSLVSKDSSMLDGLDNASTEMEEAKVIA